MATVRFSEGALIRQLRQACGWRLWGLSQLSGIPMNTINKIEMGRTKQPDRNTIEAIASAFGLSYVQFYAAIPKPVEVAINPPAQPKKKPQKGHPPKIAMSVKKTAP